MLIRHAQRLEYPLGDRVYYNAHHYSTRTKIQYNSQAVPFTLSADESDVTAPDPIGARTSNCQFNEFGISSRSTLVYRHGNLAA